METQKVFLDVVKQMLFQLDIKSKICFTFCADNKSKLGFKFWIFLIRLGIIDSAILLFMPPGHTHGSVDAIFGTVSQKMTQEVQISSVEKLKQVRSDFLSSQKLFAAFERSQRRFNCCGSGTCF